MKRIYFLLTFMIVSSLTTINIQAKTFKISTTAPNGSNWMKQMKEGASEIKKQTNGRVKFKFYPGGVMGSEEVVMKKIRINQLQGAAVSHGVLENFYPDSQIYSLPLLFRNFKEVDHIRSSFDEKIIDGLEKTGLISFGLSEGGFAYAMSKLPISETKDLTEHKVWTPTNNKQAELILKSFGINPIPLNIGDVLTGLQTNIIDTVAVSPIAAIALQWHTQFKYLTDIPLSYIYATMIVDKKQFNKISMSDQKIVKDIMRNVFSNIDKKNRQDNINAFKALQNQGLELIKPKGPSIAEWFRLGGVARNSIEKTGTISEQSMITVKKLLEEIRITNEITSAN